MNNKFSNKGPFYVFPVRRWVSLASLGLAAGIITTPLLAQAIRNPAHAGAAATRRGHGPAHDTPAEMMMGGTEKGSLVGTNAIRGITNQIIMPSVGDWAEGLIKLDEICETIEPPQPKFAPGNPAPGTKKMAALLQEHFEAAKPESMAYLSDKLADIFQSRATNATELNEKFRLLFNLALQQINASRPDSALNTFAAMEKVVAQHGGELDARTRAELRLRKGIAFFRLGEQENCLAVHNADSCLFPLRQKAFHLLPRGSQGAVAMFGAHLAEFPGDYSTRWLLNLAHMTLGEYPDKVKPEFLISPEHFASEHPLPRFVDVSDGLGIDANDLAGGAIIDDFDNDGFYDVVISAWDAKGQLRYFRNNQNGKFVERTSEAGLVGEVGSLNIVQTDYNNDGWMDLWLMRGGWLGKAGRVPSSLLRNNQDGTFTDVTVESGLLRSHPTMATRWFDFNGDGWLDLFIGNESLDPEDPDYCELFRNNRDGTFTECARESGIQIAAFIKGVACGDFDNDGRPDLYLSVRSGNNILLHNAGPRFNAMGEAGWRFRDVTRLAGPIQGPGLDFGTFAFDYNNDGWDDIICFGYWLKNGVGDVAADYLGLPHGGAATKCYRNNGDGSFTDVSAEVKLDRIIHTMGHNFGDLDNDGWLDFYSGTGDPDFRTLIPNRMFRNAEGKFFQDVTTATGTGHIQKGHAVAFADFDDDGFQDVYATYGGAFAGDFARNALYHNPTNSNGWIKLKLTGVKANRPAIGAKVMIQLETPGGVRTLFRTVSTGGSFGGNPLRLEIGTADATAVRKVEIRWPGAPKVQLISGLQLRRSYEIIEDAALPKELKLTPVNIKHAPKARMKLFEAANKTASSPGS